MMGLRLLCLFALVVTALSDVYMHNPRGSNNRLNERSANRNNANRLFDSQNNNRGGYNAGDKDTGAFQEEDDIYYMKYFQSGENADSFLTIEWTNQHGCGGDETTDPHKLNCNMVLQYMVMDEEPAIQANELTRIRNGKNTNTQDYQNPQNQESKATYNSRRANSVQLERGLHESFEFYDDCYRRTRNMGLFTADQRLRSNNLGVSSAIYTRQNPNGNRRGYECPEERDYYPYWHPTPWRDMAILTDNTTLCDYYETESFNVRPRNRCRERYSTTPGDFMLYSVHNNMADCVAAGGDWVEQWGFLEVDTGLTSENACNQGRSDGLTRVWAIADPFDSVLWNTPQCLVLPPPPECRHTDWSRVNHLGNGRDGVPLNYTWRIPYFSSQNTKLAVVRIRYNISTDDYNPWTTDAMFNENLATNQRSPVTQNPNVNIGSTTNKPLRLAINTAQFGRTFQDRTHVMELRPRSMLPATGPARECTIYNLNVRGKRGNIVQVYPSVEYDFVPNRLTIDNTDCLHIQWTGSNTHNNGNPAGDGQAGDAGEGTGGTDKSNIVEIGSPDENYPLTWEKARMFRDAKVLWASFNNDPTGISEEDLAIAFASAGYYYCKEDSDCGANSVETKNSMQQLLNNAPASFEGALLQFSDVTSRTVYHYICSRNNNFTNRSQKGQLTVEAPQK